MADPIVRLLAGLIPACFSAIPILLSSTDITTIHLINPALKHVRSIRPNHDVCHTCAQLIGNYIRMSLERVELIAMLSFLAAGFLSQSIVLFLDTATTLPGLSFLLYAGIPSAAAFYFVWLKREIFHWWKSTYLRFALSVALGSSSAMVAINPKFVSVIDIVLGTEPVEILGGFSIPNAYLQMMLIAVAGSYIIARLYTIFSGRRSLRNILLDLLGESPQGATVDNLIDKMTIARATGNFKREEVKEQLQKLIYQELVSSEMDVKTQSEIYRKL